MFPAIAKRIYDALEKDACSDAVVLLKEIFPEAPESEQFPGLVRHVSSMGDHFRLRSQDYERAEHVYRLGLALYEKCFFTSHIDSLPCLYGLLETLRLQNKHDEIENTLNRGYLIIRRLGKSLHAHS